MRVIMAFLCATAIFSSPFIAFASSDEETVNTENEINQQIQIETEIKELTLNDVITKGIENSRDLRIFQLNIEIMKNEVKTAIKDKKRVSQKLEDALDDLNVKKESTKQALTSSYINLLLLHEQIDNKEKSVQSAVNEVNRQQVLYRLGRITKKQLDTIHLAKENAEKQLSDMERSYQISFKNLCSQIGVPYNPEVEIKPIHFEVETIVMPKDLDSLIENSNQVQRAIRSLETAKSERYQVYRDDDASKYEKENQDYYVQIAEENLVSTKEEVQRAIEELYKKAEQTYLSYQEAVRQLADNEKELQRLEVLYNLGRVSKYDLDQAGLGLFEAELKIYQTKLENYQMKQSLDALQRGLFL